MAILKKTLTRRNFEKLIAGNWEESTNSKIRKNKDFLTNVDKGFKYCSDGTTTIKAKSWVEIARALNLA